MDLKRRIEQVLSEILSDKYDCKIALRFGSGDEKRQDCNESAKKTVA